MTPKISIIYVTGRLNPHWEWFIESFCQQLDRKSAEQRENIEIVFIDRHAWVSGYDDWNVNFGGLSGDEIHLAAKAHHDPARKSELRRIVGGRFNFVHIPPAPCAWQGPFRQTKQDWFCAGHQRNTGFIVAKHPYLAFVDDLSVLMPLWLDQVIHAAEGEYVVCGAYKKVKNLRTVKIDPFAVEWDDFPPGVDSRWTFGGDGGIVPWHGSGMFGCSFGLPLEAALEVDGNDAACNGQGAEDYDLGIRLERAGWEFFYNRNLLTLESEEAHYAETPLPRQAKPVSRDRLPRGYEGSPMSDHVMLNRLVREHTRTLPLIGENIRAQRKHFQKTGMLRVPREPQCDWRDGTPLKDL